MKKRILLYILPVVLFSSFLSELRGEETKCSTHLVAKKNRQKLITYDLSSYLLPEDSEIKAKLDKIFQKGRVTLNSDTLVEAGFTTGKPRKYSKIVVTKHPHLPGYVFKIYLDKEKKKPDEVAVQYMIQRIAGADKARAFIEEHHMEHLFKVPRKWLYQLPEAEKPRKKYSYKSYILVTEDMNILDKDENKKAWKTKVTEETLSSFYQIIKEVGLIDCVKIDNIPFCKDGKITFIDTESFGYDRIHYMRLKKALSRKMKDVWRDLIY